MSVARGIARVLAFSQTLAGPRHPRVRDRSSWCVSHIPGATSRARGSRPPRSSIHSPVLGSGKQCARERRYHRQTPPLTDAPPFLCACLASSPPPTPRCPEKHAIHLVRYRAVAAFGVPKPSIAEGFNIPRRWEHNGRLRRRLTPGKAMGTVDGSPPAFRPSPPIPAGVGCVPEPLLQGRVRTR